MIDQLLSSYNWCYHPNGPQFCETYRDAYRTAGHFLFQLEAFSSLHKVTNNEELWLIHAGKLLVHVLHPDGSHQVLRLGLNLAAGERPVVSVPTGYWQAAKLAPDAPFAFGTNVCAPCFSYDAFEIARRADLLREFPQHKEVIERLTREE